MNQKIKPPLDGIRVIDFSQVMAGPYCTMVLGDLGAEVIKIEPPIGDYSRRMPPHYHHDDSAYYLSFNRNKKSVVINLKDPSGLNIVYDMVKKGDVVVDNFRPGVMDKLKLNYERLREYNKKIISCSITGFGLDSPYSQRPALDLIVQGMGGAMSFTGEPGQPPVRMGIPMGDLGAGVFAIIAILAALNAREKIGVGQNIDMSMLDCQLALMTYRAQYYFLAGELPQPVGSGHVSSVPIRAFKTKDNYLVIDSGGEHFWRKLCDALSISDLKDDPKFETRPKRLENKEELMAILEERFATKPRAEWLKILIKAGVPAGPVNNLAEALSDPSVVHRQMIVKTDRLGEEFLMVANPIKMSETKCETYKAPPSLGQDTHKILHKILNYSDEKINELINGKIINQEP